MRVFVTGATGFVGSAVVANLIQAGHQVQGLTRSDAGAQMLTAAGATPHRGDLADLDSLRRGADMADGVIHCAFDHDFSKFAANCEQDRRVIGAMGSVLAGSDRPMVITSGTGMGKTASSQIAFEDVFNPEEMNPRVASELEGALQLQAGVNVSVVRLPQVHNTVKQGLISYGVAIAREKGVSAYIGEGQNRWPAAHLLDVAAVFRGALERRTPGARYHAVAEEGIAMRDIAEVIGRGLKVPVVSVSAQEAPAHFGWLSMFAAVDMPASSAWTRQVLGWTPVGPGMLEDLAGMNYK